MGRRSLTDVWLGLSIVIPDAQRTDRCKAVTRGHREDLPVFISDDGSAWEEETYGG